MSMPAGLGTKRRRLTAAPFGDSLTTMLKSVEKVLAYITRDKAGRKEVLVFEHHDVPSAGIQVPAGTVEPGEEVASALLREVFEESGLRLSHVGKHLGRFEWIREDRSELHFRNVFHVADHEELPDDWRFSVVGHGEDSGLVFRFHWLSVEECISILAADQGKYLHLITEGPSSLGGFRAYRSSSRPNESLVDDFEFLNAVIVGVDDVKIPLGIGH